MYELPHLISHVANIAQLFFYLIKPGIYYLKSKRNLHGYQWRMIDLVGKVAYRNQFLTISPSQFR